MTYLLDTQIFLGADVLALVRQRDIALVCRLPHHHRDPFELCLRDEQAVERMTLITADPQLTPYDVPLLRIPG